MSEFKTLNYSIDGYVAQVVLCRPEKLNYFDALAHEEFLRVTEDLKEQPQVRAVLLSAEGRAFSAGGDIAELAKLRQDSDHRQRMFYEGKEILQNMLEVPAPIVTAVQGDAIGLGSSLVTLSDMAVICKSARIIDPHVGVGLVAGDGGSFAWPHSVGMMRARRYLLTGDPVPGDVAFEMGLVSDLVDTPEDVLPAAQKLVDKICNLSPLAVQGTKKALSKTMKMRMEEIVEYAFLLEEKSMLSQDCQEALDSWKEKRKPTFTGR